MSPLDAHAPGVAASPVPATDEPVADLVGVSRVYHMGDSAVRALDDFSFRVQRGEFWAVMGASGSGKSTLLNVMGCLDRPTEGVYRLGSEDTGALGDDALSELRSRRLGFIFQSYNLIPQLDVLENVMVPLFYQDNKPHDGEERALELTARVGLESRLGHKPPELSGGQQQRVAIARALVNDPELILADEPTGNLDSHTAVEILDLFGELHDEGKTIVFVTHELSVAERASHVLHMRDGRIEQIEHRRTGEP